METSQAPPPAITPTSTNSSGIFGTKIPASIAFVVVILLFLLPFAEIKCGDVTIANQTGLGFATNQDWKPLGIMDKKDLQQQDSTTKNPESNSQIILIVVLGLALLGFIISILDSNAMLATALGILGTCGLIYFFVDLKSNFDSSIHKDTIDQVSRSTDELGNTFNNVKPTLSFAPAFWISLIVLLAAAFLSWQRRYKSIVISQK